jgi:2-hydroxycyclohexanecarboxyl-CoA dehydrogenase
VKKLQDKATIVTGGASGIGRAIAEACAREGARVAIVDLNAGGARDTVDAIEKAGGVAAAWPLDITDVAGVGRMVDEVAARWGGVHVLVNCAGWDKPMPFVDTTPEFWDKILAINLRGPIACTRAALRHMMRQQARRARGGSSRSPPTPAGSGRPAKRSTRRRRAASSRSRRRSRAKSRDIAST